MKLNVNNFNIALAKSCLTLKMLSEKSGISMVTLYRISNGAQVPRPKTIGELARVLNVPVEKLIEE